MSKQGGKTSKGKYIEIHQTFFVFIIVMNVIVLLLSMILLGMQLIKRENNLFAQYQSKHVEELMPISYKEVGSMAYQGESRNFMPKFQSTGNLHYNVIKSRTELTGLLDEIQRQNVGDGSTLTSAQEIKDSFFEHGSVVALAYEQNGLESFTVGKITRDENGSLTLLAKSSANQDIETVFGKLILIQIDNVKVEQIKLDLSTQE